MALASDASVKRHVASPKKARDKIRALCRLHAVDATTIPPTFFCASDEEEEEEEDEENGDSSRSRTGKLDTVSRASWQAKKPPNDKAANKLQSAGGCVGQEEVSKYQSDGASCEEEVKTHAKSRSLKTLYIHRG